MTDELDEILGQYAGFASIAWDEDGVFKTDDILTKTKEVKQAIQALIADQMAEYQAQLLKDYKEDIATAVREARIDELKQIEPPEQYIDYAMISGHDACAMCGFNAIKFREYIEDRVATLNGVKNK